MRKWTVLVLRWTAISIMLLQVQVRTTLRNLGCHEYQKEQYHVPLISYDM